MLRQALRAAIPRTASRTRQVRAYRPTLALWSTSGRRPIPLPLETPMPDCSSSAPFSPSASSLSPLKTVPPAGSDPLPPPDVPRAVAARRSLLLFSLPVPPSAWPSHLEFASPLLSEASNVLKRTGVAVNAAWDGVSQGAFPSPRGNGEAPPNTNSDADSSDAALPGGGPESYPARLIYPDGKVFDFPAFTERTLDSIELRKALMYRPGLVEELQEVKEVLVCTHGSRDCRCSDHGRPLVAALRDAGITVHEIAHVGGHKWAANALLLPSLDMLSNLRSSDAAALAEFAKSPTRTSALWAHWRGRFGLGEQAQHRQWEAIRAAFGPAEGPAKAAGTTVPLTFRTFEGEIKAVDARLGESLLLVAHEHDLPAMEGTCGGNAECATCHCYLAPRPRAPPVPEPSEDELDMLDFALDYRDGMSRLGCQIEATPELARWCAEGGVIDLPRF